MNFLRSLQQIKRKNEIAFLRIGIYKINQRKIKNISILKKHSNFKLQVNKNTLNCYFFKLQKNLQKRQQIKQSFIKAEKILNQFFYFYYPFEFIKQKHIEILDNYKKEKQIKCSKTLRAQEYFFTKLNRRFESKNILKE